MGRIICCAKDKKGIRTKLSKNKQKLNEIQNAVDTNTKLLHFVANKACEMEDNDQHARRDLKVIKETTEANKAMIHAVLNETDELAKNDQHLGKTLEEVKNTTCTNAGLLHYVFNQAAENEDHEGRLMHEYW